MSNLLWLALSWILVAALCYFIVFKLSRQSSENNENERKNDKNLTSTYSSLSQNNNIHEENSSTLLNTIVKWINQYTDKKFDQIKLDLLNGFDESARRLLSDESYDLKFDKNIEKFQIDAPEIKHFTLTNGPLNQISANAHIIIKKATLKLLTSKRKNDRYIVNNYEAILSNIEADIDIRIASIAGKTHAIICFAEAPISHIALYDNKNGRVTGPESLEIHDIITKSIGASIVDIKLEQLINNNEYEKIANIDDMVKKIYHTNDVVEHTPNINNINRLHVNIVRGYDLNIKEINQQPFVIIEMDEPQQKHITNSSRGTNPAWDETFDFDLSNGSDEILFEIYNPANDKNAENTFIGLAIVGINELIKTKNPVQYLKLQGRPYHNDDVNGTLLVQFDFSSNPNISTIGINRQQIQLNNNNGLHMSETIIHSTKPLDSNFESSRNIDLEPIQSKTTTVTVKGVQKNDDIFDKHFEQHQHRQKNQQIQQQLQNNNYDLSTYDPHDPQFYSSSTSIQQQHQQLNQERLRKLSEDLSQPTVINKMSQSNQNLNSTMNQNNANNAIDFSARSLANHRSGSEKRKRERSFFGELKDRLNRKRRQYGRSKSADPASPSLIETESCPPSRDQSQGPCGREYDDHARFTGDESSKCTLVLELQRNGENKYFLIPPSIAKEPAAAGILKKGKKLHLCKNHTFVAVKSTGGIVCNACSGKIATGFNKQAYQCRACRMVCHKACHTLIQTECHLNNSMKLSLAKDVDWAHYLSHSRISEYISAENL